MEKIICTGEITLDGSLESAEKAVLYTDNPEVMEECMPLELLPALVERLSEMAREKSAETGIVRDYRFIIRFTENQVYLSMTSSPGVIGA